MKYKSPSPFESNRAAILCAISENQAKTEKNRKKAEIELAFNRWKA
jgi:hypothetical protein